LDGRRGKLILVAMPAQRLARLNPVHRHAARRLLEQLQVGPQLALVPLGTRRS